LQQSAVALADILWDVLVIGAGPAGAICAVHLARSGHRVLLMDKAPFPREKPCGDGMLPGTLRCLERAGLSERFMDAARPLEGIRLYSLSGRSIDIQGSCWTLERERFDALLVREAVDSGAAFCLGEAEEIVPLYSDGVATCSLAGSAAPLKARFIVAATGASTTLLREAGMACQEAPSALAVRCYVLSPVSLDRMVFSSLRELVPGYCWIFPMEGGKFNMGCIAYQDKRRAIPNLRETFQRLLEDFSIAGEIMKRAEEVSELKGGTLRCGLERVPSFRKESLLAVGETIGTTFPLTGEGIGNAMRTGELAADAIHRALVSNDPSKLDCFKERIEEEMMPLHRGYWKAHHWMSRSWFLEWVVRRTGENRLLQKAWSQLIEGRANPVHVMSLWSILKSHLKKA
jgi:geranylgeranyl reductase family protein